MQDWKKVFSSQQLAIASMVMGILNENEIPAQSMNKKDSSYVFLGEVEIYVPADKYEVSMALINSLELSNTDN
jgi:Putative prokaryotic signal transducing protein